MDDETVGSLPFQDVSMHLDPMCVTCRLISRLTMVMLVLKATRC